ncbi:lung adenoma susceptibility protein 2 [Xiphophorus couchianus]|uniref:lung adenoma susceptibility protein 2 n=1 Tax=Xiphophorus couchianus TaxID=32473 RepID=UPI001016DE06|nr:lung adenoma susceptibility protein 2 [Xiphophorus couchianus]
MESSSLGSDCLSPESTVTSLLSRSGHLRSGLQPAGRSASATFRFRDQVFDSASAALDAYITDFNRSCQQCRSLTASLVLPRSQPANHRTARNRDVLRERLTDRELDFLSLPVSSLHHRLNRDRISMTTEELLSIPCDGSMPVTHTSAFIRGVLCRSRGSEPVPSCAGSRLSSSHVAHQHLHLDPGPPDQYQNQKQNRFPARTSRSRGRLQTDRLSQSADIPASAHRAADLHLPRWVTSNKSVLGCSEVSSLPDLTYPSWVLRAAEPPPWEERGDASPGAARGRAPSWVLDLEMDEELKAAPAQLRGRSKCVVQAEGEQTLRELRLQLAEHISALTAQGNGSGSLAAPFRDNRIESLIQKADQVLDALSSGGAEGSGGAGGSAGAEGSGGKVSPVGTEDLLLSSPLRCPSPTLTTELESDQTLLDQEVLSSGYHGNDTGTQPGPVEAMKQMLFRLQAVEAELQRQRMDADGQKTPEKQEADVDPELQSFPGSPSLKRVGLYLNRLKLLVEDPGQRGRRTDSSSQQDSS